MPEPQKPTKLATFLLLGDVRINGSWQGSLTVGSRKVLALLLMVGARSGMRVDSIAEHLWGPDRPASSNQMIRSHVMALRMALPSDRAGITHSRASGYRIHHDPCDVDAQLFELKIFHGRESIRTGRHLEAIDQLNSGLKLWRSSTAMADVQDVVALQGQTVRLHELRLQAEELLAEARLQSRHSDTQMLVPGLMHLTHLHPFRERLVAQLMVALYASGRRIEALGVYTRTRTRLIAEAGMEPSDHLQRVHEAILNGEGWRSIVAVHST